MEAVELSSGARLDGDNQELRQALLCGDLCSSAVVR